MSKKRTLLKLRKQWFQFQAKNFIMRYASGLMVIALFLPGIAIGDNLQILMTAVTKPLVIVSQAEAHFMDRMIHMSILLAVFVVWTRAQSHAINGGAFFIYLKTLPLCEKDRNKHNALMLLIGNHLLWPLIIYAGYLIINDNGLNSINIIVRYVNVIFLLLICQYSSLFMPKRSIVFIISMLISGLLTKMLWPLIWQILLNVLIIILIHQVINKSTFTQQKSSKTYATFMPVVLSNNFYYLMLFKANLVPTAFRLMVLFILMCGYGLVSQHLNHISSGDLLPYAMTLEALLAYYLSGFYVLFKDERKHIKSLLLSLPVPMIFWLRKDIFTLFLMAFVIHLPFLWWQSFSMDIKDLLFLMSYHLFLLLICYPLRRLKNNNQTLISFAVLFTITAVSIYQLS